MSNKGRDAILRWCQRNSFGYDNVDISNFDTSFADGLAFCCLLDSQRPDLLKETGLTWDDLVNDFTREERLEWAFSKGDEIGIPRLLDPEDVDSKKPDPKVIITYLSGMIKFFQEEDNNSSSNNIEKSTGSFAASIEDLINGSKSTTTTKPKTNATTTNATTKKQSNTPTTKTVPTLTTNKSPVQNNNHGVQPSPRKDIPIEKQLENLERMFQKGLLAQDAYEKARNKILEKMNTPRDNNSNNNTPSSNSSNNIELDEKTQKQLQSLQKLFERGTISEEDYKKAVEKAKSKATSGNIPVVEDVVSSKTNSNNSSTNSTPRSTTSSTSSNQNVMDDIDESTLTPEQKKQLDSYKKMMTMGILSKEEFQKAVVKLTEKKSTAPTNSGDKLSHLKNLRDRGVINEEEYQKAVKKYDTSNNSTPSTTTSNTTTPVTNSGEINVDDIKEEDLDEKTKGRLKAIDRMYKCGLFKEEEYIHSRRKIIMQGLQESGKNAGTTTPKEEPKEEKVVGPPKVEVQEVEEEVEEEEEKEEPKVEEKVVEPPKVEVEDEEQAPLTKTQSFSERIGFFQKVNDLSQKKQRKPSVRVTNLKDRMNVFEKKNDDTSSNNSPKQSTQLNKINKKQDIAVVEPEEEENLEEEHEEEYHQPQEEQQEEENVEEEEHKEETKSNVPTITMYEEEEEDVKPKHVHNPKYFYPSSDDEDQQYVPKKRSGSVFLDQPNLPQKMSAGLEDYKILYDKLLKEHQELAEDYDELADEYDELKEQLAVVYQGQVQQAPVVQKKDDLEIPEELKPIIKKLIMRQKQSLGKSFDVLVIYPNEDSRGNQVLMQDKVTLK
ncbi:hypothetical protein ABK040_006715 [Willaertia magna]